VDLVQREGRAMSRTVPNASLPACLTNSLKDRRGEKMQRLARELADLMSEMRGLPCHVRFGDDFAFALVICDFPDGAD
jgi:hypothetical protein